MTTYEPVYAVLVDNRIDGLFLFRNEVDAQRFLVAVEGAGGSGILTEEPINHAPGTDMLIEAEVEAA